MERLATKPVLLNLLACAALLVSGGTGTASDFDLSGVKASGLGGRQAGVRSAPVPRARAADDTIGLDAAIRVPYATIKKAVVLIAASDKDITIIDPAGPVVGRSGEFLKVINLRINLNGIVLEPVVTLKPYYEKKDTLAIRVHRVQVHASMVPTPGGSSGPVAVPAPPAKGEPEFDKEQLTADVVKVLTDGVTSALNDSLTANDSPLKASDLVTFRYDKKAWLLHVKVSAAAIKRYTPDGFMGDVHMNGFSMNNTGVSLRFQTAE